MCSTGIYGLREGSEPQMSKDDRVEQRKKRFEVASVRSFLRYVKSSFYNSRTYKNTQRAVEASKAKRRDKRGNERERASENESLSFKGGPLFVTTMTADSVAGRPRQPTVKASLVRGHQILPCSACIKLCFSIRRRRTFSITLLNKFSSNQISPSHMGFSVDVVVVVVVVHALLLASLCKTNSHSPS